MLFICLNCDYEMEITDENVEKKNNLVICPKCGDTVFEVYLVGPCLKAE